MTLEAFWPALERCGRESAAGDWRLMAGEGWQRAPLRRTARVAESVLDPRTPARRLDVLDESTAAGPSFFVVDGDFRPRADVLATSESVAVWEVDFDKLAKLLGAKLGFVPCHASAHGCCIHVGNVIERKRETRPVFLHVPAGGFFDHENLIEALGNMPPCTLLLPNSKWITKELAVIAHTREVMLDPVAERLAAGPDERGAVLVRNRKPDRRPAPILDVQPGWTWDKLEVAIDPRGTVTAAYGRHRGKFDFRKAARSKAARHTELLATIAVRGEWANPPSDHQKHQSDRKAFERLEEVLKKLLPIGGKPFGRSGGKWRPVFAVALSGVAELRGRDEDE